MNRYISLIFFMAITCNVSSADFDDIFDAGAEAYKRGNYETAVKEFRKIAIRGDHRAMFALGSMYVDGTGVEQDYKEAYKWFKLAAQNGRVDAIYKLGVMHDMGTGVEQDYNKAGNYYSKAAKRGYAYAQHRLGLLYAYGRGVKQNNTKAYAWLAVAGQYFIYVTESDEEDKKTEDEELPTNVELMGFEKKEKIAKQNLILIASELGRLRQDMTPEELDETRKLAEKYIRYRPRYISIKLKDGHFSAKEEYLYLPEILYPIAE